MDGEILDGKYRIERLLGKGGFASVYAARNIRIGRPVALKILHPSFAESPIVAERFLREAKLACRSLHPTIVKVEDLGETEEGTPYLVMELLEGCTLKQAVREKGALPVSIAVAIVEMILEGLAAAHDSGVIHRDVKPANIFLLRKGAQDPPVRILDLGMAKDLGDSQLLTMTGDVIGTPNYVAPEILLDPEASSWTPAVDVFAVGMVLFYALTATVPFQHWDGDTGYRAVIHRIQLYQSGQPFKGPADVVPTVPRPIDRVVRRALSLEPGQRYRDAREMLDGLNRAVEEARELLRERRNSACTPAPGRSKPKPPHLPDRSVTSRSVVPPLSASQDLAEGDDTKRWSVQEMIEALGMSTEEVFLLDDEITLDEELEAEPSEVDVIVELPSNFGQGIRPKGGVEDH